MTRLLPALALLLASAATCAREGDADAGFAQQGLLTRSFDLAGSTTKTDLGQQVLVDELGRYLVVGYVSPGSVGLARFLPDGSIDTSYGAGGSGGVAYGAPLQVVSAAARDAVGRIVVVGFGRKSGGAPSDFDGVVCRYTAAGQRDTSLGSSGCRSYALDHVGGGGDFFSAVTTDGAGQIYVAGQTQVSAEDYDFVVMKLASPDALSLSTFAGTGEVTIGFDIQANHAGGDVDGATAILLLNNALYVGGYAVDDLGADLALARLSALNGALDGAFCPDSATCSGSQRLGGLRTIGLNLGGDNDERVRALAATPDGRIVVAGEVQRDVAGNVSNNYLVTRLNANGSYAAPFGSGTAIYNSILPGLSLTGLAVRSDGRIVIGGDTAGTPTSPDPQRVLWAVQLSAAGVPDGQFASGLGGASSIALFTFPNAGAGQPLDHRGGAISLDRGRLLLAGARLWRQDLPNGVQDFDFAVVRMQGDAIFSDGLEF